MLEVIQLLYSLNMSGFYVTTLGDYCTYQHTSEVSTSHFTPHFQVQIVLAIFTSMTRPPYTVVGNTQCGGGVCLFISKVFV